MRVDGKKLAETIFSDLKRSVESLKEKDITPHLVVMLIGTDPASEAYVRQKKLKGEAVGMRVTVQKYPDRVTTEELLEAVEKCNADSTIHGLIIQQPLPNHIDVNKLIVTTDPKKDVDGFHENSTFTPPIAEGVEEILKYIFLNSAPDVIASEAKPSTGLYLAKQSHIDKIAASPTAPRNDANFLSWLQSKNVVVIGKGETGGAPIIQKMRKLGIEPKIIDSKTSDPVTIIKQADVIISCVGRSRIVKADEIKKDVILLSIGMFRGEDGKLHGDYEEDEVKDIAAFYTPVPGGIGPMNVAMLLKNVVESASTKTD